MLSLANLLHVLLVLTVELIFSLLPSSRVVNKLNAAVPACSVPDLISPPYLPYIHWCFILLSLVQRFKPEIERRWPQLPVSFTTINLLPDNCCETPASHVASIGPFKKFGSSGCGAWPGVGWLVPGGRIANRPCAMLPTWCFASPGRSRVACRRIRLFVLI